MSVSFQHDDDGLVKVKVYDMKGKQKLNENFFKEAGSFDLLVNTRALDFGMYILEIRFNGESAKSRFIKK